MGEVDWIEYSLGDLLGVLRRDSNLHLQRVGSTGFWGSLRINQLYPPLDDNSNSGVPVGRRSIRVNT